MERPQTADARPIFDGQLTDLDGLQGLTEVGEIGVLVDGP